MTPEQKLWATIEKLSCMTVKRGATPSEEAIAKKKIAEIRVKIEKMRVKTGPMTGPGVRDTFETPFVLTPDRMERLKRNMKEWNDFLEDMYRRNGMQSRKL